MHLNEICFKYLCFLSFDSNQNTDFKSRQLLSVNLPNLKIFLLRFLFTGIHSNKFNVHHQVALVALNCLGPPQQQ